MFMKRSILVFLLSFLVCSSVFARSTGCKEGNCDNGYGKWVYTDKTTYEGDTPKEAGREFWKTLTVKDKLVVNEVFSFPFTMKGGDGKLHHLLVTEQTDDGKSLDFHINDITKEVQKNTDSKEITNTITESNNVQNQLSAKRMAGGKKKKDDEHVTPIVEQTEEVHQTIN